MYDGLEISVALGVNLTPQLLPYLTYHSIDFTQRRQTTALYSLHVTQASKNQSVALQNT